MQAPKHAPQDLQTKDKFLVQTTVVPFGTADEDIVPAFVSKHKFMLDVMLLCIFLSIFSLTESSL